MSLCVQPISTPAIKKLLNLNIRNRTVEHRLADAGLYTHVPAKKTLILKVDVRKCLLAMHIHDYWAIAGKLWSDGSKFNFVSERIMFVSRSINDLTKVYEHDNHVWGGQRHLCKCNVAAQNRYIQLCPDFPTTK
ncbi:hypothetical protein ABEB36_013974 [Hypothenemus hampei]|uniref:Uncharacterized protein n=1 Tax=Hypothenemus hampei TaxID=57062 RepID=A0ABD1E345_HYPHA